jgi:hypothetical protein
MLVFVFAGLNIMSTETAKSVEASGSELDLSVWSVISFERCEGSGLTYREAAEKVKELEKNHIAGLCIVTDEAATRVAET